MNMKVLFVPAVMTRKITVEGTTKYNNGLIDSICKVSNGVSYEKLNLNSNLTSRYDINTCLLFNKFILIKLGLYNVLDEIVDFKSIRPLINNCSSSSVENDNNSLSDYIINNTLHWNDYLIILCDEAFINAISNHYAVTCIYATILTKQYRAGDKDVIKSSLYSKYISSLLLDK